MKNKNFNQVKVETPKFCVDCHSKDELQIHHKQITLIGNVGKYNKTKDKMVSGRNCNYKIHKKIVVNPNKRVKIKQLIECLK